MYVAHNDETKPSIKGFFSVCQPNCNQKFKYFELICTDFENKTIQVLRTLFFGILNAISGRIWTKCST